MAILVCMSVLASCAGDDAPAADPVAVDIELAPVELEIGSLTLFENAGSSIRAAFANAGETSLMSDGRLFELRRAERLVGTLQITTLVPDVDLFNEDRRRAIVGDIISGAVTRILVEDVEVHAADIGERAQYVWFGRDLLQILTVKETDEIPPEEVLREIIVHQKTLSSWHPLPVDVET